MKVMADWHDTDYELRIGVTTEHTMFKTWQPTKSTIYNLSNHNNVPLKYQRKFWVSFIDYWLPKQTVYKTRYDWNVSFTNHCKRNIQWEKERLDKESQAKLAREIQHFDTVTVDAIKKTYEKLSLIDSPVHITLFKKTFPEFKKPSLYELDKKLTEFGWKAGIIDKKHFVYKTSESAIDIDLIIKKIKNQHFKYHAFYEEE